MKTIKGFICVSEYIRSRIMAVDPKAKAHVVYNGLDTGMFYPTSVGAGLVPARSSFGFSKDDFVAIYTGRIVPDKGVKELVQAIQLLKDEPQ